MRILLVDDEPASLKYLQSAIEFTNVDCEITGTAENGEEALEKIKRLSPDVIFTDVKMPNMNGISLALAVKEAYPHILTTVISGYQDFEYLKGAIKSGVADYLLKPIGIETLKGILISLSEKVADLYDSSRKDILRRIMAGCAPNKDELEKYFSGKRLFAAVVRKKGVVSRLSARCASGDNVPAEEAFDGYINLRGRDENEILLISLNGPVVIPEESCPDGYRTCVVFNKPFAPQDWPHICTTLCDTLEVCAVIGKSQIIEIPQCGVRSKPPKCPFDQLPRLEVSISNRQYDKLKDDLVGLFSEWEENPRSAIWVESALRKLVAAAEKYAPLPLGESPIYALEDAVRDSVSLGELLENMWGILAKLLRIANMRTQIIDTPLFFKEMTAYIESNLSEPLSLQTLCCVFGISQTYASRLFRKYAGATFIEYITKLRIEKAKGYLAAEPKIPVKDVAQMVGFADQFYFSKVFRSATGIPPSEYAVLDIT